MLLNPRRTRTNMKLLQLVSFFLLTLSGQTATTTMQVKEDDDAILNCSFGDLDIKNGLFDWKKDKDNDEEKKDVFFYSEGHRQDSQDPYFVGRVFHFPDQLQFGNASIVIRKTKTSDNGTYTCSSRSGEIRSSISLTVGATPQHYFRMLDQTKDWSLLQCVVEGAFPEPEVVWVDSDGKILPADEPKVTKTGGNKYDTVLNITVTKTGHYTCVATQDSIRHQSNRTTLVHLNGAASKPSVTILGEKNDGVLLQCEVFGASPELKVFWKTRAGESVPSEEPQRTEKGGSYDIILQTTVTKTDYYRCVTTEGNVDDELYSEILVPVPEEKPRGDSGSVVGVLGLVAIVVAAVVVVVAALCIRHYKKQARDSTKGQPAERDEMLQP